MKQYDPYTTLTHIMDSIDAIERFIVDGARDEKTLHAVARMLEVMGEATNRLSQEFRKTHADIPWRDIIDMRNALSHGYDMIRDTVLWSTISSDLPPLYEQITAIVKETEGET